ncbi:hypothetical protein AGMMS50212_13230 [Spirochaetia bacterium]|nr:hypothetical protein AGMMS50212_13230 [Spirochaetia bacterium]
MTEKKEMALVSRVKEFGLRDAAFLENGSVKILIDDIGGMIPQFLNTQEKRHINAHWQPVFRANSDKPFDDTEHGTFWKNSMLYNIAGAFSCIPNVGSACIVEGETMPANGWSANLAWKYLRCGNDPATGAAWSLSEMNSPSSKIPLSFKKIDAVMPGQPVHYTKIKMANSSNSDIEICVGFNNMLGAPFLQPDCIISAAADDWCTPPPGGEFDTTTRLAMGAEFIALTKAPLAYGGKVDLSKISGPLGYTDIVIGAIPGDAKLGWTTMVNPKLKLVYLCFFTGPSAVEDKEIALRFNNILMQYGGRHYTPWSPWEGGTDINYCVGMGNSISAYNYGLDYSRRVKKLLDAPTTVVIPAKDEKTLCFGSLFAPYENSILDSGIVGVDAEENKLICKSATESWKFNADSSFAALKKIQM